MMLATALLATAVACGSATEVDEFGFDQRTYKPMVES